MWDSNPKLPDPYPMLYHLSYRDQAFSIPCFWTWTLANIAFKYLSLLGVEIWEEKIQLYIYYSKQFSTQRDLVNLLRPRQNGRHFADDIFNCIFLNENVWIPISLKFVPKVPINNIPALFQIMAWRCPGDKPLSEPMVVSLPTHIWVTRPQWLNVESPSTSSAPQYYAEFKCTNYESRRWRNYATKVLLPFSAVLFPPSTATKVGIQDVSIVHGSISVARYEWQRI